MTTTRTRIAAIALTGGAAVVLAACSSGGSSPSAATNAASTPPPAATSGTSAPAATTGKTVSATETEFHIALSSKSMKAGTYTFKVKNAGTITHALTVDGPGVSDKSTGDLSPGDTAMLTVTLKPGSYDVFCPIGNHKMEGMDETVKVS